MSSDCSDMCDMYKMQKNIKCQNYNEKLGGLRNE